MLLPAQAGCANEPVLVAEGSRVSVDRPVAHGTARTAAPGELAMLCLLGTCVNADQGGAAGERLTGGSEWSAEEWMAGSNQRLSPAPRPFRCERHLGRGLLLRQRTHRLEYPKAAHL